MTERFQRVLAAGCELGESPVWLEAEQRLAFVDITGRRLHQIWRPRMHLIGQHETQRMIGRQQRCTERGHVGARHSGPADWPGLCHIVCTT